MKQDSGSAALANSSGTRRKQPRDPARARLAGGGQLHVVWTTPFANSDSAATLHNRLRSGQESQLFELESWECGEGHVRARLTPKAPLEDIVDLIFGAGHQPSSLWWSKNPTPKRHQGEIFQPASD